MIKEKAAQQFNNLTSELARLRKKDECRFECVCSEILHLQRLDRYGVAYVRYWSEPIADILNFFYKLVKVGCVKRRGKTYYIIPHVDLLNIIQTVVTEYLTLVNVSLDNLPRATRKRTIDSYYAIRQETYDGDLLSYKYDIKLTTETIAGKEN